MLRNAVARAIFEHAGDGMIIADDSRRVVAANPAACALFGRAEADMVGSSIDDIVALDPAEVAEMWTAFVSGGALVGRVDARRVDGSVRNLHFTATANLVPGLHLSLLRDLTDQLDAEQARLAEREARAAARALAESADRERKLAADLHDSIGQGLALLKLSLEQLSTDSGSGRLGDALDRIDALIRQTRAAVFDLHPTMLDHLGLVPTLRHYAERRSAEASVAITVGETGTRRALAQPVAQALFRTARELVTNSLKHAAAAEIVVTVHWAEDGLRLVVDDDGCGFDVAPKRWGVGLESASERIVALGGTMSIESDAGSGSRVVLECAGVGT